MIANQTYSEIIRIIKQEFDKYIESGHSLRAVARTWDMDPGSLSRILSGKRKISFKQALQLFEYLKLSEADREKYLELTLTDSLEQVLTTFHKRYNEKYTVQVNEGILQRALNEVQNNLTRNH